MLLAGAGFEFDVSQSLRDAIAFVTTIAGLVWFLSAQFSKTRRECFKNNKESEDRIRADMKEKFEEVESRLQDKIQHNRNNSDLKFNNMDDDLKDIKKRLEDRGIRRVR